MKNSFNLVLIMDLSEVRVPSFSLNLSWILLDLFLFTIDLNICQVRFTLLLLSFKRSELCFLSAHFNIWFSLLR